MSGRRGPAKKPAKKSAAKKKPVNDEAWIISLDDVAQFVRSQSPDQHADLLVRFQALLSSTSIAVRELAVEGLIEVVEGRDPEDPESLMELGQGLVERLLEYLTTETAKAELTPQEEKVVEMIMKLFDSLDASDGLFPPQLIVPTVALLVNIMSQTKLAMGIRASGAQLIVTFVESSGPVLSRDTKLVETLTTTISAMCLDPTPEPEEKKVVKKPSKEGETDDEHDDDTSQLTPSRLGLGVLDAMKEHIQPSSLLLKPVYEATTRGIASADKQVRRNGYQMMAMVSNLLDGKEEVKTHGVDVATIFTTLLAGVNDKELPVRATAWEALQELCGKPQLPVVDHAAAVMKAAFAVIEYKATAAEAEAFNTVIAKCLLAVTELIETAGDVKPSRIADVTAHLQPLMTYAMSVISATTSARPIVESCWFLIRTIADAWADKAPKVSGEDSDDENDTRAAADEAAEAAEEAAKPKAKAKGVGKKGGKGGKGKKGGKAPKGRTEDEDDEDDEEPKKEISGDFELGDIKSDSKSPFVPFYEPVMKALARALQTTSADDFKQRASATACLSGVATCIGAEKFKAVLPKALQYVFAGMELGNSAVRNASFAFIGDLSELFGYGLRPHMTDIVRELVKTLDPMYCVKRVSGGHGHQHGPGCNHDDEDHDHDGEGDEDGQVAMTLNQEALEEQQMAFHCVTQLFQNCGGALRPFSGALIEQILEGLEAPFMGPQLQLALIQSLRYVYRALPARKYAPGASLALDGATKKLTNKLFQSVTNFFDDDDAQMVSEAIRAVRGVLKYAGPIMIQSALPKLMKFITAALNRAIPAASGHDGDDDEDGEGDDDEDDKPKAKAAVTGGKSSEEKKEVDEEYGAVLDEICDLIATLAKSMAGKFEAGMTKLMPSLIALTDSKEDKNTRMQAIGAISEACQGLEGACVSFLPTVFPLVLKGVNEFRTQIGYARNCAFGIGVMCLKGGEQAATWYDQAVAALLPVVNLDLASEEVKTLNATEAEAWDYNPIAGLRDNAISALGKMILMSPKSLKLADVVPAYIKALPLTEDFAESQFVYSSVIKMINLFPKQYPGIIEPHFAAIAKIFESVLANPQVSSKVKTFVDGAAKALKIRGTGGDAVPLPEPELPAAALPPSAPAAGTSTPSFSLAPLTGGSGSTPVFSFPTSAGFSFGATPAATPASFSFAAPTAFSFAPGAAGTTAASSAATAGSAAAAGAFAVPSGFAFAPSAGASTPAAKK